jgi:predicted permease
MGALSAGLLILLAAIANFGNLALARSLQRRAEFATREAIGASRRDIARLVLVELTVLTSLGLTAALGFAAAALKFATYSIPNAYTAFGLPRVTPRVVVFASIASVLVVVGGMIPMLIAKRPVSSTLIQESHTSESKGVRSWRFLMTMAQCAVTVLLLVGSSLLVRSEFNLAGQDIGMMGDTFVVTALYPSRLAGGSPQFLNEVEASIDRLSRLPGVAAVGATFGAMADNATVLGMGVALNGHRGPTAIKFVSTDYFKATGSVLIEGRFPGMGHDFAVLSASLAKQCCPDRSAVGLTVPYAKGLTDVVGVVKDSFDVALDQPPTPTLFLPLLAPSMNAGGIRVHYLLRQPTPSANMGMTVDRQLRAIDADVRVVDEGTLNRRLLDTIRDRSFATLILTFFAAAASIVSASGLIGVVGSTVARRTREIAIRISLGANAQQVRLLVTREALVAAASGGIAGLIAGGVLSRFLESLLYGIHPADPLSTAIAALVMLGVVGAAAAVPAKRATSLMPTIALRME